MKSVSVRSLLGQSLVGLSLIALAAWFWHLQNAPWPSLRVARETPWLLVGSALAYALLLWVCLRPSRAGRARAKRTQSTAAAERADWHVFHASQTGFALEVAEHTTAVLESGGQLVVMHAIEDFDAATFADTRCLFIVSTTGEGDPPDRALAFAQGPMQSVHPLQGLEYGVLALGDRSYAQFCAFGHAVDRWLGASGAVPLFDLIEVDNADPKALQRWQDAVSAQAHVAVAPAFARAPLQDWQLVERQCVNPGSAGGAVWQIHLRTAQAATWNAGDIAEVLAVPADASAPVMREYSIASVPEEGHLMLLVRLMHDPAGQPGIGSGWLCARCPVGGHVQLRIRRNPNFHTPAGSLPLVLIGNGTGIAGLRAHLQARIAAGETRNWLLFGERNVAHDRFFAADTDAWEVRGLLRVDRVYSRDGGAQRYVQDALMAHADTLRAQVAIGASVMVCGSLEGMAPGVDRALRDILGDATVDHLLAEGRYRRDVY